MTTTPPDARTPEPGWYADPSQPDGLRWWDGATWTGYTRPRSAGASPVVSRPPLGPGWSSLAVAVQVALGVAILVDLAWVVVDAWGWGLAEAWGQDSTTLDPATAHTYDTVTIVALVALWLTTLVAGVLFIVWLFRGYRSDRVDPRWLRYRPGWAVAGWFVPIWNLFRPVQLVLDMRQGTAGRRAAGVPMAWWATWLVSGLVTTMAAAMAPDDTTTDALYLEAWQRSLAVDAAGSAVSLVSGVLAVLVVRSTTRMVEASPHGVR